MNSKAAEHRLLRFILPARVFAAVESGTKEWLAECPCGNLQDYWGAGGVRYKADGEPRRLTYCPSCKKSTMQRIRKKTDAEKLKIR